MTLPVLQVSLSGAKSELNLTVGPSSMASSFYLYDIYLHLLSSQAVLLEVESDLHRSEVSKLLLSGQPGNTAEPKSMR